MDLKRASKQEWTAKRLLLSRQQLGQMQAQLASAIKARQQIAFRHQAELTQLRAGPFRFSQQTALLQQHMRELIALKATTADQCQALQTRHEQQNQALELTRP
ncbi:hypothetical protein [Spirosoma koreense]